MKTTLALLLLLIIQPATSGNIGSVSISPSSPRVGDTITVSVYAFCPYGLNVQNSQGLTHLFETEEPNRIILTYIIDTEVGCILQPPIPPFSAAFELGVLEEGTYSLETFFASEQNTLPTQNGQLHSTFNFQVGPAPAPTPIDTLSNTTKLLLFALMFLMGLLAYKKTAFKN